MKRTDRLTAREREILLLIARFHFTSKEASRAVHVTPKRVDEICASAVSKLEATDRRDAVRIVLEEMATPGENAGAGSSPAPLAPSNVHHRPVSEDKPGGDAYAPATPSHVESADQHAERRGPKRPDLGRPGASFGSDRLPGQAAVGGRADDGALETEPLLPGAVDLGGTPEGRRVAGLPGALAWVSGRAAFSELTLAHRLLVILLVAGVVALSTEWVAEWVLRFIRLLGPIVGHGHGH